MGRWTPESDTAADPRPSAAKIVPLLAPSDDPGPGLAERDRVLVVEDEYLVALQAEAALSDAGFEVVGIAPSAPEAVRMAVREAPHLVIMDIRLTGPDDGIDAAIEILQACGVRSVFVTAHVDPATRGRAQEARPLGWLRKPYMMHDLVRASREAIARLQRGD